MRNNKSLFRGGWGSNSISSWRGGGSSFFFPYFTLRCFCISRVCSLFAQDKAGYFLHISRINLGLPCNHPFFGNTVLEGFEYIFDTSAVNPVGIGEVRTYTAFQVLAGDTQS